MQIVFRIDSQLYHSLSTVVALTYETQKCVSLSELSAMSSSDVLVEMMMMTSGGRSPDHSGGSPPDRFETCCAPFLARLDRDAAWDAVREFVGRVAAVDFETAVALLQAEAPRRFFRDPASLCEKILLSSSADVDVDLLVSFSAFVSSPSGRPLVAGWCNIGPFNSKNRLREYSVRSRFSQVTTFRPNFRCLFHSLSLNRGLI